MTSGEFAFAFWSKRLNYRVYRGAQSPTMKEMFRMNHYPIPAEIGFRKSVENCLCNLDSDICLLRFRFISLHPRPSVFEVLLCVLATLRYVFGCSQRQ